ncbi:hypothetical protein [Bacillus sp. FJAT-45066]|uniref:hypothetical protein n=1 Tax=Bacillus sp. FJAT-45066 TaxID=2011010 RepID=UPI000BB8D2C5|nr:hypothetical protein [Bacillus sp. FJAT-45066]
MKNHESKHYYILAGLATLLIMPILVYVGPFVMQGILFDSASVFLIKIPTHSRWMFAIGCLILAAFFFISFFFHRKGIIISIVGVLASLVFFVNGTYSFQLLGQDEIAWSTPNTLKVEKYAWTEVEEVVLHIPSYEQRRFEGLEHLMVFTFKDGNTLTMVRDKVFTDQIGNIDGSIRRYQVSYRTEDM